MVPSCRRINDNVQLNVFGLHNGNPDDRNNLSEKWEGMTLVSALDPANPRDFFYLFRTIMISLPKTVFRSELPTRTRAALKSIPCFSCIG
jgi:hypothetical protein